jgi:hypothetical protein
MAEKNGRQTHGYRHPGYVADSNPNLYYFAFEDMKWSPGADRDFWDINYKMVGNGVDMTVTIINGVTGYTHYLYQGAPGDPGRKKLFDKPLSQCNGQSITVKGDARSSYGMNSMAGKIEPGLGEKLIIMDYDMVLAAGSPLDETSGDRAEQLKQVWSPDPAAPKAPLKFARHFGQCNVLFGSGAVRLVSPQAIHPDDPDACCKYWNP